MRDYQLIQSVSQSASRANHVVTCCSSLHHSVTPPSTDASYTAHDDHDDNDDDYNDDVVELVKCRLQAASERYSRLGDTWSG